MGTFSSPVTLLFAECVLLRVHPLGSSRSPWLGSLQTLNLLVLWVLADQEVKVQNIVYFLSLVVFFGLQTLAAEHPGHFYQSCSGSGGF
jgi:hypothetical protein